MTGEGRLGTLAVVIGSEADIFAAETRQSSLSRAWARGASNGGRVAFDREGALASWGLRGTARASGRLHTFSWRVLGRAGVPPSPPDAAMGFASAQVGDDRDARALHPLHGGHLRDAPPGGAPARSPWGGP